MGLLQGSAVFLAPPELLVEPSAFSAALVSHGVSVVMSMPTLLATLADGGARLPKLRLLYLTGEAYGAALLNRMRDVAPGAQLMNLYGMTETCGHVCSHVYAPGEAPAMGTPSDNTGILLAGAERRDPGRHDEVWAGEVWVAGLGLSPGYLDQQLNDERFITRDGVRYFMTGDMAELLADGALRYAGRADRCVKVFGFRVELDGVEASLLKVPGVRLAAVVYLSERQQLVAYVTPATLSAVAVRTASRAVLPAHAVPALVLPLEELPLTASGKLDRKRLPAPPDGASASFPAGAASTVAAVGAVEAALCSAVGSCGLDDSLTESGATSLQLVALMNELRPVTTGEQLSVAELRQLETPRRIAARLSQRATQQPGLRPARATAKTRCLFLHGHASDSSIQRTIMEATGWLDKRNIDFIFIDGPYPSQARPDLFESLHQTPTSSRSTAVGALMVLTRRRM
jgi:mycobactin phenyloxazoline synthetase